jgi:hypothetical protein
MKMATRETRRKRATRAKKIKSRKYYKKSHSRSYKGRGGGHNHHHHSPPSYVGSIQGEFINSKGQQMFRNPVSLVGGIA